MEGTGGGERRGKSDKLLEVIFPPSSPAAHARHMAERWTTGQGWGEGLQNGQGQTKKGR